MEDEDPRELSEEDRATYLREWFLWHMEHEPEPDDAPIFRRVEAVDPGPYL
jgi:hypothetical protein